MTKPNKRDGKRFDDMQLLRDIILGEEKDRLHKLDLRITDLESRTADVAEVLPGAMNRLVRDPASQPEFERPVVESIRGAIKRDTESFAEVLFPVLGPAIRRAVADALQGLVQRINAALENSFTIKGLKWRMEAARSGEPFAQIVLRHTMVYAVQEAFLIQRGSGLIIASVHQDELLVLDEDAVAAMLTAIQSFIQDSFGLANDEPLRSAELGERTVWVINGPAAVLACVITGAPPRSLRDELMRLLELLHARFGDRLGGHPQALEDHEGLRAQMNEALRSEVDQASRAAGNFKLRIAWIGAGLLLLTYLAFTSWHAWQDRQLAAEVEALFKAQPGYVITHTDLDDGVLHVSGLLDPAASTPESLLASSQIALDRVATDFRPYQSLEPDMVVDRLQQRLGPSTTLQLKGATLVVNGTLTGRQMVALKSLPDHHPLIRQIELGGSRLNSEEAAAQYRATLNAPETVHFVPAEGNRMEVTGTSGGDWYSQARVRPVDAQGWQLDFEPLGQTLLSQLDAIVNGIDGQEIQFSRGTRLAGDAEAALDAVAAELLLARALAISLGLNPQENPEVVLEGSSDGSDSREKNSEISARRSQLVKQELISRGLPDTLFAQSQAPWAAGVTDPGMRKVTIKATVRAGRSANH